MGWVPRTGDTVVDRSGTHFVLTHLIGEGGQGVVYATRAEGAAVKITTAPEALAHRTALEAQIARVARMPLADLPVAAPRYALTGSAVGYTMTLLTGMTSLRSLTLNYGAAFDESWYVDTGGLRKRLLAVEVLADLISTLHGRGLVYCDLSANNVLVSASPDRGRLFLIDLDNLRPLTDPPRRIFTPDYAAPEQAIVGATQSTDLFSLAVVAFSVLTAANPFYGNLLDAQPPEAYWEAPFAAAGPWIDDPDNDSNRWPHTIPRDLTVSPVLARLFTAAFTIGRHDPAQRPDAALLSIAARRARYAVTRCPGCGWDNYVSRRECASCGRSITCRRLRLLVASDTANQPHRLCPVVALPQQGAEELSAAALGLLEPPHVPGLRLRPQGDRLNVDLVHDALVDGAHPTQRTITLDCETPLVLQRLHRGPLVITLVPAGGLP